MNPLSTPPQFLSAAVFLSSTLAFSAWSAKSPCPRATQTILKAASLRSIHPDGRATLQAWKDLSKEWKALIPQQAVEEIAKEIDQPLLQKRIADIFEQLPARAGDPEEALISAVTRSEQDLTEKQVLERVKAFLKNPKAATLRSMAGELSLEDLRLAFTGPNSLKPSAESWLGQYIDRTGAQVLVRRFSKGLGRALGDEKLVVAVSPQSFQDFLDLIAKRRHFLFHIHTPSQGTLALGFEGQFGHYANLSSPMRAPTMGTLMPGILLSSTESERARLYFQLGAGQRGGAALTPWTLEDYCATGGYSSCTHWFGNIPVGDKKVTEYSFPGFIDEHASNSISSDKRVDKKPRVKKLRPYSTQGMDSGQADLLKRVWKVPGNEQLADVLGLKRANLAGEFANPGWVAHSLLGGTDLERIPVVFWVVDDHTRRIPKNFPLQIDAY
jgi:hypothetical protein